MSDAWEKIYNALSDPKFEFRTVRGIARVTKLSEDEVQQELMHNRDKVRIPLFTDNKGQVLYTRRDHGKSMREILSEIRTIVSAAP